MRNKYKPHRSLKIFTITAQQSTFHFNRLTEAKVDSELCNCFRLIGVNLKTGSKSILFIRSQVDYVELIILKMDVVAD